MALAVILGTLSVLGVSIVYFLIQLSIPHSSLQNFFDLVRYNNSPTLQGTPLYQRLNADVDRQMALFSDPIAYLIGGLVLAKTVSRRYSHAQVALAAGVMAFVLNAITLALLWGSRLAAQQGHLLPGQVDSELVLMQILMTVFWVGLCAVGAELGLRWRRAKDARTETNTAAAVSSR